MNSWFSPTKYILLVFPISLKANIFLYTNVELLKSSITSLYPLHLTSNQQILSIQNPDTSPNCHCDLFTSNSNCVAIWPFGSIKGSAVLVMWEEQRKETWVYSIFFPSRKIRVLNKLTELAGKPVFKIQVDVGFDKII